ncbi:MAG: response regulator [Minisyncoccota bacterium]
MDEKKRILIVEDDDVLRDVLAEKLEKSGYVVDSARDGVIAMEKVRASKPDLVLLDILMPRKSGVEVLEEFHADQNLKDIPVIIISNSGQPLEIERAQELGARDFLIKAVFDPDEVLDKVRRVFAGETVSATEWGLQIKDISAGDVQATPTQSSPSPVLSAQPVAPVASSPVSAADKIFVLVIEDDKFLRELLVRKLASEGFDVQNAVDATSAFPILAQRKPSIILLDLILPGVDGFEILSRIKADPKIADIPVIILSNLGQKEDTDKAMALGAKDFMVKANFTLDEIVTKVRGIVG